MKINKKENAKRCALFLMGVFTLSSTLAITTDVQAETYDAKIMAQQGQLKKAIKAFPGATVTATDDSYVYDFSKQSETKVESIVLTKEFKTVSNTTIKGNNFIIHPESGSAVVIGDSRNTTIDGNLDIQSIGSQEWGPAGLSIGKEGSGEGQETHVVINGNVTMKGSSKEKPYGVYTTADNIFGGYLGESGYQGTRWSPVGISLGQGFGSTLDINGMVDLNIYGTGIETDPFYVAKNMKPEQLSTINIKGGTILTPVSDDIGFLAIANYGGTINMNMNESGTAAADNNVNIVGHLLAMKDPIGLDGAPRGGQFFFRQGTINLGLNTPTSRWEGMIDNTGEDEAGEVNIYLGNKATWDYSAPSLLNALDPEHMPSSGGKGSLGHYDEYDKVTHVASLHGAEGHTPVGQIIMNHENPMHIGNYSGNVKFIYSHNNNGMATADYTGGNIVIDAANDNSNLHLITNNSNVNTNNKDQVVKTLNALAGKLTYKNYADNHLTAYAEIASGLTGSATTLKLGNVSFDNKGIGKVLDTQDPVKEETIAKTYTEQIVMDNYKGESNREYWEKQGVLQRNKDYVFSDDAVINTTFVSGKSAELNRKTASIMWAGYFENKIDLQGHVLTLQGTSTDLNATQEGINMLSGRLDLDNVGGININLKDDHRAVGIDVDGAHSMGAWDNGDGHARLNIHNDNKMEHAVKIRLDVPNDDSFSPINTGIAAHKNTGDSYAFVNIDGMVDIDLYRGHGIRAQASGKGIAGNNYDPNLDGQFDGAQIYVGGGKINVKKGYAVESTNNAVVKVNANIDGEDILPVNKDNLVAIDGNVLAARLGTLGIALSNKDSYLHGMVVNDNEYPSVSKLYLGQGSQWINEDTSSDTEIDTSAVKDGSVVTALNSDKGFILQKDKENIKIGTLKGDLTVSYAHTGDGTSASSYAGLGDVHIAHADAGSHITMLTDSKDIDINTVNIKNNAFNALAGKLFFEGIKNAEYDVKGNVVISSGLTSSAALATGVIQFNDKTGQGYYSPIVRPDQNLTTFTTTITGNRNTDNQYVENGVLYTDNVYTFRKDSNVTLTNGENAIHLKDDVTVNASKRNIGFTTAYTGTDVHDVTTILNDSEHSLHMTAENTKVEATTTTGNAVGISLKAPESKKSNTVIDGSITVLAKGNTGATGILVGAGSDLTINTGATIGTKDQAIVAKTGEAIGIHASNGANVKVLEGLNIYSKQSGIKVENEGTNVDVLGNTQITIAPEAGSNNMGLSANNGTISINQDSSQKERTNVNIEGNASTMNKGAIKLSLANKNSSWKGVSWDTSNHEDGSGVQLEITNKGLWENTSVGTAPSEFTGSYVSALKGASSLDDAGYVLQNDNKPLTIGSYEGNVKFMYRHDGTGSNASDYKAGDIKIIKAKENAGLQVFTDEQGIDTRNAQSVNKVFSELAKKVWYDAAKAGDTNLYAKLAIASGLTNSAVETSNNVFGFNSVTGQGEYKAQVGILEGKQILPDENEYFEDGVGAAREYYKNQGILTNEDNYEFHQDAEININDSSMGLSDETPVAVAVNGKNHTVDMGGHSLTINAKSEDEESESSLLGFQAWNGNLILNNANNILFTGTSVPREDSEYAVSGIRINENGHIDIQNVKNFSLNLKGMAKDSGILLVSASGTPSFTNLGMTTISMESAGVAINQMGASKDTSTKVVLGGANLRTAGYDVINVGANNTFILNENKENDVTLLGDVRAGDSSKVVLNLSTKESKWNGLFSSLQTSNTTIGLSNGAEWVNTPKKATVELSEDDMDSYQPIDKQYVGILEGAATESKAGTISRESEISLTINKLKGFVNLVYAHDENGAYKAGDTTVNEADTGAHVNMITDNNHIDMQNKEAVTKALTGLANKLIYTGYKNGERNLSATAKIASGLTSSATMLTVRPMDFNEDTGRGILQEDDVDINSQPVITGNESKDVSYKENGELNTPGTYSFNKDLLIKLNTDESPIHLEKTAVIDATGHNITLDVRKNSSKQFAGLFDEVSGKSELKADNISITARNNKQRTEGIHLTGTKLDNPVELDVYGNTNINVNGSSRALGAYTSGNSNLHFHNDVTMTGNNEVPYGVTVVNPAMTGPSLVFSQSGLYAGADYTIQKGAKITVDGKTNIAVNGGSAVTANGGGSHIALNGDVNLTTSKVGENTNITYAAVAMNGIVDINVNDTRTASTNHNVVVNGNIGILKDAVNAQETFKKTEVNLGLDTPTSALNGVIVDTFTDKEINDGNSHDFNLHISNGATWTNQTYGNVINSFEGSHVHDLVGGATAEKAGIIRQNDSRDITVDSLDGTVKVVYAKAKRVARSLDEGNMFKAGDFVIKSAKPNSNVIAVASNVNVDPTNKEEVKGVLSAVASKLIYSDYANNPTNLLGKAMIASGLTTPGIEAPMSLITFKNNDKHRGELTTESVPTTGGEVEQPSTGGDTHQPSTGTDTNPSYTVMDYETSIMKGIRCEVMNSAVSWRGMANDVYAHMDMLRQQNHGGIWASVMHGSDDYTNAGNINGKHTGFVVGYDNYNKNGWTLGASVRHDTGSSDSTFGSGSSNATSIAGYGIRTKENGTYVQFATATGQLKNQIKTWNEIWDGSQGLYGTGDYTATGVMVGLGIGKKIALSNGRFVNPYGAVSLSHVEPTSFIVNTNGGMLNVDVDAYDSVVGKAGISMGRTMANGMYYGKLEVAHDFTGSVGTTYTPNKGEIKTTNYQTHDTWATIGFGLQRNVYNNVTIKLDVEKTLGSQMNNQNKVNATIQYKF